MVPAEIVGFALGVLASLLAWFVVWRLLSPKMGLSPRISKISAGDDAERRQFAGDHRWRVKVRNRRRRRFAMEVRFEARLRFRSRFSGNMASVVVGTSPGQVPVVAENLVIVLDVSPTSMAERDRIFVQRQLGDGDVDGSVGDLDALLQALDEAHVRFVCIATDSYSGSRRAFLRDYHRADVAVGPFRYPGAIRGAAALVHQLRTGTHPTLEVDVELAGRTDSGESPAQDPGDGPIESG